MSLLPRSFVLIGVCTLLAAACVGNGPDSAASTRPACVTLESYGYVIEQVMKVSPDWAPLAQIPDGFQTRWTILDDRANHTLAATLTSDGCVCATTATSHFHVGEGQDELVGYLQGAAVAPVSELDYTATWLEPRLLFSCTLAFAFRRSYESEALMEDGTSWKLACSRGQSASVDESLTTLRIVAPACADLPVD